MLLHPASIKITQCVAHPCFRAHICHACSPPFCCCSFCPNRKMQCSWLWTNMSCRWLHALHMLQALHQDDGWMFIQDTQAGCCHGCSSCASFFDPYHCLYTLSVMSYHSQHHSQATIVLHHPSSCQLLTVSWSHWHKSQSPICSPSPPNFHPNNHGPTGEVAKTDHLRCWAQGKGTEDKAVYHSLPVDDWGHPSHHQNLSRLYLAIPHDHFESTWRCWTSAGEWIGQLKDIWWGWDSATFVFLPGYITVIRIIKFVEWITCKPW